MCTEVKPEERPDVANRPSQTHPKSLTLSVAQTSQTLVQIRQSPFELNLRKTDLNLRGGGRGVRYDPT